MKKGRLTDGELFWRDHYSWLKDAGYLLRARYSPGWSAPWKGTNKSARDFEDGVLPLSSLLLDATRISDGSYVVLKQADRLDPSVVARGEAQIFQKVSSQPLASDPKNHCIRLIEILQVPDTDAMDLIVMPLLLDWERFPFATIGEAIEFFTQVFEGLQFLHKHNIWHGDCKGNNIMMDGSPVLRDVPHPWRAQMTRDFRRELRPIRSRTSQNPNLWSAYCPFVRHSVGERIGMGGLRDQASPSTFPLDSPRFKNLLPRNPRREITEGPRHLVSNWRRGCNVPQHPNG
ncbi:hypothetical protein C8R47DRAFT_982691 [Mycena vitilis]|nr:hypothetical protein C8R47DRAFT_982691 [Mycena vitilis]